MLKDNCGALKVISLLSCVPTEKAQSAALEPKEREMGVEAGLAGVALAPKEKEVAPSLAEFYQTVATVSKVGVAPKEMVDRGPFHRARMMTRSAL